MNKDRGQTFLVLGVAALLFVSLFSVVVGYEMNHEEYENQPSQSVSRTVLVEEFGYIGCGGCVAHQYASGKVADEYSRDQLAILEWHVAEDDPYYYKGSGWRRSSENYSAPWNPVSFFDGMDANIAGSDNETEYENFKSTIDSHLGQDTYLSMDTQGSLISDSKAKLQATVTAENPVAHSNLWIHFVICEDHDVWEEGHHMRFTVEDSLPPESISISQGETLNFEREFNIESGWNLEDLYVTAFVQTHNWETVDNPLGTHQEAEVVQSSQSPLNDSPPGEEPEITITSPAGGEVWSAETQHDVTWTSTAGDDSIDYINLEYSTDGGVSWTVINTDLSDTGSYTWIVPNEDSTNCLVKGRIYDTQGRCSTNQSDSTFTIEGAPPEPPGNLSVINYSSNLVFEDGFETDKGWMISEGEWEVGPPEGLGGENGNPDPVNAYEGSNVLGYDLSNNGDYENSISSTMWATSPTIDLSGSTGVTLEFQRWLNLEENQYDKGYIEVYDGSSWQQIWENPSSTITENSWNNQSYDISEYADGNDNFQVRFGLGPTDEGWTYSGWNIDNLQIKKEGAGNGTEHNLIKWDASPDDPSIVSQYNVYRSDQQSGPWNSTTLIDRVSADGSAEYDHLDVDKGTSDETFWWYVVRAEGKNGAEESNINAVQEPNTNLQTMNISFTSGSSSNGWNFVSFYLDLTDTDLGSILDDPENGISGNYDKVMYYDAVESEWQSYIPGREEHFNGLNSWDSTMGVWIQMNTDDTLTVEGTEPTSTDITLNPGWNMVGLPSSTAGNHGLPQEVSIVGYFDASQENNLAYDYNPDNFEFIPGEGYYIYNDADYDVTWSVEY
ncbi:MAG: hypothetical protein R6W73_03650 [Candidatus Saliniplasma sp.]